VTGKIPGIPPTNTTMPPTAARISAIIRDAAGEFVAVSRSFDRLTHRNTSSSHYCYKAARTWHRRLITLHPGVKYDVYVQARERVPLPSNFVSTWRRKKLLPRRPPTCLSSSPLDRNSHITWPVLWSDSCCCITSNSARSVSYFIIAKYPRLGYYLNSFIKSPSPL